jgi:hypothetical protein
MNLPSVITLSDVSGKSFQFNQLENLVDFLKTEAEFWRDKHTKVTAMGCGANSYLTVFNTFQNAINQIETWTPNLALWDTSTLNGQLSHVTSNYFNQLPSYWVWSGHDFVEAWIASYQYSQATGEAFLEASLRRALNNFSNFEYMRGYLLAYEFAQQDESLITKRRDAEKASFANVRTQLAKKKDELISEVSQFQEGINEWKTLTNTEVTALQNEQKQHYEDSSLNQSKSFQERLSAWVKAVADLEEKYKEKLRFDGPASYWKKSAEKFEKQGYLWATLLVMISCTFIFYLSNFFIAWLQGQPIELKLQTLEGVVLFASVVSAFAILVRTFSRLAFSAFHLQRDAEEREQLSHLYLSLSNETDVDAESRKIVLQALFSRSETGLLANESGPTMPGIGEVVNLMSKGGK